MIKEIIRGLLLWSFALFYGAIVLFKIVKDVFTNGYGKVFNKVKREMPACLSDPDLGMHGFLHLEDVRIHYVSKGPEDKPLMLFVHGFPEFWYSWRNQLQEFSKDYRCVAIDMRGYGESDKPSGMKNYQMKYLTKDLQQVIHALGYKSCVLVAHDWGGAVAWSFARFFPECVDKLIVLNCPSFPIFEKILQTDKKQLKMSWYMFFFQLPFLPEIMIGSKDFLSLDMMLGKSMVNPLPAQEIDAYKYTLSQPGALTPPINFYRAAFRCRTVPYDMDYSMPVLLIWGMKDTALCDKLPDLTVKEAPAVVVKRIEDSSHFVQLDAPNKVNEAMREWLTRSPSE